MLAVFVLRRIGFGFVTLWLVSLLIFFACEVLPGDAAQVFLGQSATAESVNALRREFGLDRPIVDRYGSWLLGAVHGDWGNSLASRVPVAQLLSERLQNSVVLTGAAAIVAVPLGLLVGLFMVLNLGGAFDRAASLAVLCFSAMPEFLLGTVAVVMFAVKLSWFPSVSYVFPGAGLEENIRALVLPVATLSLIVAAYIARMTRATLANLMAAPFIEMAVLKGASRHRIIVRHGLINVIGPLANLVALNLAYLVSGVVVVEAIFSYPGIATLMVDAVKARDVPVIQACAMLFCFSYIVLIIIADIAAILFNPRLRREAAL